MQLKEGGKYIKSTVMMTIPVQIDAGQNSCGCSKMLNNVNSTLSFVKPNLASLAN